MASGSRRLGAWGHFYFEFSGHFFPDCFLPSVHAKGPVVPSEVLSRHPCSLVNEEFEFSDIFIGFEVFQGEALELSVFIIIKGEGNTVGCHSHLAMLTVQMSPEFEFAYELEGLGSVSIKARFGSGGRPPPPPPGGPPGRGPVFHPGGPPGSFPPSPPPGGPPGLGDSWL
ncbi:hypothetical protein BC826DRAFT_1113647 [Russula brevipes]|nr:hypothetical protein BC826DRAFT_1113647 [Russula brevipes]